MSSPETFAYDRTEVPVSPFEDGHPVVLRVTPSLGTAQKGSASERFHYGCFGTCRNSNIMLSGARASREPVPTDRLAATEPRLLGTDRKHRTGIWGPIFFVVWIGEVEVRTAQSIQGRLRAFANTLPGGRAVLFTVVEATAPLPSSQGRTALSNILSFCSGEVLASVVIMEGDGFRASAVRSVATGVAMLARQPFPHRVFRKVDEGAAWVCSALPGETEVTPVGIWGAVRHLRGNSPPVRGTAR